MVNNPEQLLIPKNMECDTRKALYYGRRGHIFCSTLLTGGEGEWRTIIDKLVHEDASKWSNEAFFFGGLGGILSSNSLTREVSGGDSSIGCD